jgi:YVTN family beta-propeller protein
MMNTRRLILTTVLLLTSVTAYAGQAPFAADAPNFPLSGKDRVYAAEQFSNTVSVIDPSTNTNPASSDSVILSP